MKKSLAIGIAVASVVMVIAAVLLLQKKPTESADCLADAPFCQGTNGPCTLKVTVTACAAGGKGIAVKDTLAVCTARKIVWVIEGADEQGRKFKFADSNGIDFKRDYRPVFDPAQKQKGPFRYEWTDNHPRLTSGTAYFEYTVNVVKQDDTTCDSKDPRISNQ
jgi:hypothetical protein